MPAARGYIEVINTALVSDSTHLTADVNPAACPANQSRWPAAISSLIPHTRPSVGKLCG